jgi:hypothetical protein
MTPRPWLTFSLFLNVLLAVLVGWCVKMRETRGGVAAVSTSMTNRVVRVRYETNQLPAAVMSVNASFHWTEVESTDYRVYMANLRAIGCPEATIRDIIVADVNDLFRGRVRDLVNSVTGDFWQLLAAHGAMGKLVNEKGAELGALSKERDQLLEELFEGKDPVRLAGAEAEQTEKFAQLKQTLDFLPDETVAKILAIRENTEATRAGLEQERPKTDLRKEFKELEAETERRIQALLTPAEFDEYKLRMHGGRNPVEMTAFEASEEELRAIARLKMDAEPDAKQLEQLLGKERLVEYRRALDSAYEQTLKVTDRYDLPAETAALVYQMQKEAQAEAGNVRRDKTRSIEERQATLQVMQAEAERSIEAALGPRVFKTYRKYNDWLSSFAGDVQ